MLTLVLSHSLTWFLVKGGRQVEFVPSKALPAFSNTFNSQAARPSHLVAALATKLQTSETPKDEKRNFNLPVKTSAVNKDGIQRSPQSDGNDASTRLSKVAKTIKTFIL